MSVVIAVIGSALIILVLWDAFETIVLPRRVTRRVQLTRLFLRYTWRLFAWAVRAVRQAKRRERLLGFFGPLSLLLLLIVWAIALVLGFAMLHRAFGSQLNIAGTVAHSFGTYFYMSGVTFFTLGYGDVAPVGSIGRALAVIEAGVGFGFLAIVIGYLPVLYQSFSRREVTISMLDARAGSPSTATELLRRHGSAGSMSELEKLLHEWERWSAELLESHLSYPVLSYYRSQHDNQSWLSSLTTIMDTCSLVIVGVDGAGRWQAQLTFAMARHAIVDIAQILNTQPLPPDPQRLTKESLAQIRRSLATSGLFLSDDPASEYQLGELRQMYEPYVYALSLHLLMPLPYWVLVKDASDNWQTSAWEHWLRGAGASSPMAGPDEDEHLW